MYEVDPLPVGGDAPRTRIWITEAAAEMLAEYLRTENPRDVFVRKLDRYARNGFEPYEGNGGGKPVRHEGDGVYRIGEKLFRLIGFYAGDGRRGEFIVIAALVKRGQALNAADRRMISVVVGVKQAGNWTKREPKRERTGADREPSRRI